MLRVILSLALVVLLAACGSGRPVAGPDIVAAQRYSAPPPPTLTVVTTIRDTTGGGAHSSLIINASQRVVFDPAGSFTGPEIVQRGDVVYGMTPAKLHAYLNFQSSKGFHVVAAQFTVSPAVAEQALRLAQAHGAAAQGMCTDSVSSLMAQLPGFTSLHTTLFPRAFMKDVAKLPGAVVQTYRDGDVVPNGAVVSAERGALADM